VRGSVTLLAGGENTWRLMDGNMLGKVRVRSVDLYQSLQLSERPLLSST
jgi:hypothetical protein